MAPLGSIALGAFLDALGRSHGVLDDIALQESAVLLGCQSRGHHVPGRNGHVFVVIATDLIAVGLSRVQCSLNQSLLVQ